MKRYSYSHAFLFFGLMLSGCQSSKNALQVARLPGYDMNSADHILFLNFKITGLPGQDEKVELLGATPANGKFKQIAREVHYPYQIKVVPRYSVSHMETPLFFEHPLRRLVEVPEETGELSKAEIQEPEGTLQVRLQYENTLTRIDIYSLAPDQPERKIYTLNIKP